MTPPPPKTTTPTATCPKSSQHFLLKKQGRTNCVFSGGSRPRAGTNRTECRDSRWLASQEAHESTFVLEPVHINIALMGDDILDYHLPSDNADGKPYIQRLTVRVPDVFVKLSYEDIMMIKKISEQVSQAMR